MLALIGIIPIIGIPFDVASGVIAASRDDALGVTFAVFAIVPFVGDAVQTSRKIAQTASVTRKSLKGARDIANALATLEDTAMVASKIERAQLDLAAAIKSGYITEGDAAMAIQRASKGRVTKSKAEEIVDAAKKLGASKPEAIKQILESSKLAAAAKGMGRPLNASEIEEAFKALPGVSRWQGNEAAFHVIEKNGKLVPEIIVPKQGITDVELAEELIHLGQAQKIGLEEFRRIQARTDVLNFLEQKGANELATVLKLLSIEERMQVLEEVMQYVKYELEAKKLLIADAVLKRNNITTWASIEKQLKEYTVRHNRQLDRLERARNAVK